MAISTCVSTFGQFQCRNNFSYSGGVPRPGTPVSSSGHKTNFRCTGLWVYGLSSSLICNFPHNFVKELCTETRRNRTNICVAEIGESSWSNKQTDCSQSLLADEASADASPVDLAGSHFLTGDSSVAIHVGERFDRLSVSDEVTTAVEVSSTYYFKNTQELIDYKENRHSSYEYGRYGNRTTATAEKKICALEGAESTLSVASGMYSICCLLLALVPAGGHIVTTTDCYRKTQMLIDEFMKPKMGITATVIDPADIGALDSALNKNNVSLFFSESPTNPFLRCVDIELVSKLCHERGVLVCIDGTFASPINQKALTLGADIVIHSATKYISGHNNVLGGCISGPEKLVSAVRKTHHILGGILDPNAASRLIFGMKTMGLRVQQQNSTAFKMAQILEAHPKVRRVYYLGLPSHPEHQVAKRQMTGFGGVVSFEVDGDLAATRKFIDALRIPYIAPSFGSCESMVSPPAIMSYWDLSPAERAKRGIMDNLVRFSFGTEAFEDLKADIFQALETV